MFTNSHSTAAVFHQHPLSTPPFTHAQIPHPRWTRFGYALPAQTPNSEQPARNNRQEPLFTALSIRRPHQPQTADCPLEHPDPPLVDAASTRDTGDSFPDKFGHSTGNHYLRRYNSPARGIDRHGLRWWNGRHEGLKILWPFGCAGSSPARSTKQQDNRTRLSCCF